MPGQLHRSRLVRSSRNILLRRLTPSDQALLEPHVEETLVNRGAMLIRRDDQLDSVHFPDSAMFSLVERIRSDKFAEIAVVGREGMLGWSSILGCDNSGQAAICQMPGSAIRIPAAPLLAACERSPTLWQALLQFVHILMLQMARAIASHLQDPLDQRLAR